MNFPLSIFDNTFETTGKLTFLEKELSDIKNDTYIKEILSCRHALLEKNDKDLYKKSKSKLKAVTFGGVFENGRRLNNLSTYNRVIVIDIDGLSPGEVNSTKTKLTEDKYILALWISPSSLGLKGLVKIDSTPEEHKDFFSSLSVYFLQNYGIELDKSGSDITRLCYVSWDRDIYINYNSDVFDIKLEVNSVKGTNKKAKNNIPANVALSKSAYATEGLNNPRDRTEIKKITKYLSNKNITITDNYTDWVKVAVIIANSFSYDIGENYFLSLCRIDNMKHDEFKSKELLKFCYNNRKLNHPNRLTFSTLVYLASLKGYIKR